MVRIDRREMGVFDEEERAKKAKTTKSKEKSPGFVTILSFILENKFQRVR